MEGSAVMASDLSLLLILPLLAHCSSSFLALSVSKGHMENNWALQALLTGAADGPTWVTCELGGLQHVGLGIERLEISLLPWETLSPGSPMSQPSPCWDGDILQATGDRDLCPAVW